MPGYQSQNLSEGGVVNYWGFAARVVPCTNDPGTCEYFESVYGGHERGILYTGILWSTIGGILLFWAIGRHFWAPKRAGDVAISVSGSEKGREESKRGGLRRVASAIAAATRRRLLPESMRLVFGRTTRLQILILVILTGYLAVFSFVGIWYKTWITPVKGYDNLYQKRSWLGSWSDRLGTLAYALTPFSILLASRESILSELTGIPYQSFNFLHRWLGYIIFIQSLVHTIGWTVIEAIFYQPQPDVANKWIKQLYMIWGCVAMIIIFLLFVLSTPWAIRLTGYEFFRKAHYVLAMVYIGACWGHWEPLKVFMVPGLAIWLFDRAARLARSFFIHWQYLPSGSMGFLTCPAAITTFPDAANGDVIRLDYTHPHNPWKPGQHFYLCFTKVSIWQSHPFTPLSLPVEKNGLVQHSYILRAKGGETKKLAEMAVAGAESTPVVMQGPYGEDHSLRLTPDVNVLCVAGGTGITYVLPTLLWLINQPAVSDRKISLVWSVRRKEDIEWVRPELDRITSAREHGISITVHVTQEEEATVVTMDAESQSPILKDKRSVVNDAASSASSCSRTRSFNVHKPSRADLPSIASSFVESVAKGRTVVYVSGPGPLVSDLRQTVASLNDGSKVWRGDETGDVQLVCDDRLEW